MKKIKIILADSDFNHAKNINKTLIKQGYSEVRLIDNYTLLINELKTFKIVDLLIIDSSLTDIKLIKFLTELVNFKPFIKTTILSTDITNKDFTKYFFLKGVDYIIARSITSDDFEEILSILFDKYFTYISDLGFSFAKTKQIRNDAKQLINSIKIKTDLLGYQFLVTAVELVFKDYKLGQAASKGLYPEIALHHQTSSTRVERSIRYAIKIAIKDCGQRVIAKALNISPRSKFRISNLEMIYSLVEIMKK
jgi:two-component system response regulator (stage 0 sporulation protein A)